MMTDIDRIREALQFIDASNRETWLRMGMAIKSELADTGFDLWGAWSLQAESFNGKDARDVWKSIRAGGKVTIGSLFYEAKANGWRDEGAHQKPTPEELAERKRMAAERAAQEEAEIARERADTAKKAAAILKAATEAKVDHPYLSRKRVSPVATLREIDAGAAAAILGYPPKSGGDALAGRLLVVPVKQGDGLSTLELIDESGRKAALAGRGSKVGGYWATERLPDGDGAGLFLLIGEGVATVLSAKEASGHPAIAALSSGNLPTVAKAMRGRYHQAEIVILADLVKATGEPDPWRRNPGKTCVETGEGMAFSGRAVERGGLGTWQSRHGQGFRYAQPGAAECPMGWRRAFDWAAHFGILHRARCAADDGPDGAGNHPAGVFQQVGRAGAGDGLPCPVSGGMA